MRPLTSDNQEAPPPLPSALRPPPPVLRPPPAPVLRPHSSQNRHRRFPISQIIGFVLIAAIVGYLSFGNRIFNTDNDTGDVTVIGTVGDLKNGQLNGQSSPSSTSIATSSTSAATPGLPAGSGDNSQEPVVHVAASVIPSVVRISTALGQGSGIIWDAENGYIVTNHHVIRNPFGEDVSTVEVTLADGTELTGEVVGSSANQDVSVVRVDTKDVVLEAAEFASTQSVKVGQLAVAVGSPFDLTGTVTSGIVSSVRINPYGGSDPDTPVPVEMIQTDAPINPGNSGGALADRYGRVIGMNTSIQTTGEMGNVGVGFAVPSDTVELIANRIINGESLDIGFLGISSEATVPNTGGVLVTSVVDDSPAAKAGIRVGDEIIAINGNNIDTIAELSADIKLYQPGATVEIELLRGYNILRVTVKLGSYSASAFR